MINLILDIIGQKRIYKYLIEKENFSSVEPSTDMVWRDVFQKVPEIRLWIKGRETQLLKSIIANKNLDLVTGQMSEWFLVRRQDIKNTDKLVDTTDTKKPVIDVKSFVSKWENNEKSTLDKSGN